LFVGGYRSLSNQPPSEGDLRVTRENKRPWLSKSRVTDVRNRLAGSKLRFLTHQVLLYCCPFNGKAQIVQIDRVVYLDNWPIPPSLRPSLTLPPALLSLPTHIQPFFSHAVIPTGRKR
jgi:hypothetical protein